MRTVIRENLDYLSQIKEKSEIENDPLSYGETVILDDDAVPMAEVNNFVPSPTVKPPSGKGGARRKIAVVSSGLLLGVLVTLGAYYHSASDFSDGTIFTSSVSEISTVTVTAIDPAAHSGKISDELSIVLGDGPQQMAPVEPSGIVDYAKNAEVPLEKRKFLHTGADGGRAFGPVYIKPYQTDGPQTAPKSFGAKRFAPVAGKDSRFGTSNSRTEWQGGWYANNPKKNLELGTAYKQYLKDSFGNNATDNLSSFQAKGQSRLLHSLKDSSHGPKIP